MNLVLGPYMHRSNTTETPKLSMYTALERIDGAIQLIKQTGLAGLTNSTATLGLNLTHLIGTNVIVTNDLRHFNIIVRDHRNTFTLTGCLIQDTFHNIVNPLKPRYLISLNRQLIDNSDDLIETIYNQL
jgi:hypothetical protein